VTRSAGAKWQLCEEKEEEVCRMEGADLDNLRARSGLGILLLAIMASEVELMRCNNYPIE
jgi:hypothetical protein